MPENALVWCRSVSSAMYSCQTIPSDTARVARTWIVQGEESGP